MTRLARGALLLLLTVCLSACGSEEGRALCEVIHAGNLEEVEALIAQGADVNEKVSFQGSLNTPTRVALMALSMPSDRKEAIAIAVLESGGDPNLSWGVGSTSEGSSGDNMYALAIVARGGSVPVVKALVKAGARLEGEQGGEALVWAAQANRVEVLRVLADAGADVNYKGKTGETPLGAAVEARAREAISFLDECGAREW